MSYYVSRRPSALSEVQTEDRLRLIELTTVLCMRVSGGRASRFTRVASQAQLVLL